MQRFANLLDRLVYTQSRNHKIALLADYFRTAPDPDRGWALASLTDGLPLSLPLRRMLTELLDGLIDPVLYQLSRDYVGDTAETVALLWPDHERGRAEAAPSPLLATVVTLFSETPRSGLSALLGKTLDSLDARGRWALLKLLGGAPRVGVSARLAKVALAEMAKRDVTEIEEVWHGIEPPYLDLFAWLDGRAERPDTGSRPVFRPVMLAHPIEDGDWGNLVAEDLVAEWKWDGIRVQIASVGDRVRIYSRAGDDISPAFPDVTQAFLGRRAVLDGELLVARNGEVAEFNDLQQRLNRKTVTAKMLADYPAHVRLYDILFDSDEDLRALPFSERRLRLEAWFAAHRPPAADVSEVIPITSFADLEKLWAGARQAGIEGLMLKRRASPYLAGRPKGHWFKWKRAPLTLDCVLMYAQRGSGKRSSFYSDYTFGVWRQTKSGMGDDGTRELVPVGKAYFGFTDEELRELDRWIRNHTTDRFGPVRAVEPGLVFEVAFDSLQPSTRHKSGLAMRFPRIHRIRWDKPADEADTIEGAKALLLG